MNGSALCFCGGIAGEVGRGGSIDKTLGVVAPRLFHNRRHSDAERCGCGPRSHVPPSGERHASRACAKCIECLREPCVTPAQNENLCGVRKVGQPTVENY